MAQAKEFEEAVTTIPVSMLQHPLIVFRITDQISTESRVVRFVTAGVQVPLVENEALFLLRDEELLILLNRLTQGSGMRQIKESIRPDDYHLVETTLSKADEHIKEHIDQLNLPFVVPNVFPMTVFWPSKDSDTNDDF